jgi:hypothetical protein
MHLRVNSNQLDDFLRVRIEPLVLADLTEASYAVRISAIKTGYPVLGCAVNSPSGIIDFVTEIPADTDILVTLASIGAYKPVSGALRFGLLLVLFPVVV